MPFNEYGVDFLLDYSALEGQKRIAKSIQHLCKQ